MSIGQKASLAPRAQPTESIRQIRTQVDVVLDLAAHSSARRAPRHRVAATVDTLASERGAEDALLALLARGIREAADSQPMRILRATSAHKGPTEVDE